jgi:membrane protease YdiL (CAAX protease family)
MTALTAPSELGWPRSWLLVIGFGTAVLARLVVGGAGAAQSPPAGLLFALLLLGMSIAARTRVQLSRRALLAGVAGAVLVCLPVALLRLGQPMHAADGYLGWAAVVGVVAAAEEVFLRGTLYDAVCDAAGDTAAVLVGALAFAALHVPLYGWHVVPLDLAVGVLLGELRRATGTPAAPAVTHVTADLAAWFLR